jgi:hypothetical protein
MIVNPFDVFEIIARTFWSTRKRLAFKKRFGARKKQDAGI